MMIMMMMSKGQNPLHGFPRSKSVTKSWRVPRNKSPTSPQHKRQVRNKLTQGKVRCVCCVVSFPKFCYNDLLTTCWQLPRLRGRLRGDVYSIYNGFWF